MKHLATEELAIYVEALLKGTTKKLPLSITEHISSCDECAAEAIEVYEINKTKTVAKSKNIKTKLLYYTIPAVAASFLVFLAINFNLFNTYKNGTGEGEKISGMNTIDNIFIKTDSSEKDKNTLDSDTQNQKKDNSAVKKVIHKKHKEVLLASAFRPDEQMEKLVDRYKGTLRGEKIKIITPNHFETKSAEELVLKWKDSKQEELTIEIFNNESQKIEEATISANQYKINKDLQKGLYYWKLFNQDFDLLFCGKILFK